MHHDFPRHSSGACESVVPQVFFSTIFKNASDVSLFSSLLSFSVVRQTLKKIGIEIWFWKLLALKILVFQPLQSHALLWTFQMVYLKCTMSDQPIIDKPVHLLSSGNSWSITDKYSLQHIIITICNPYGDNKNTVKTLRHVLKYEVLWLALE